MHQALLALALASLTRVLLLGATGVESVPLNLWPGLLIRGGLSDLLVLPWLMAPALIWWACAPASWARLPGAVALRLFRYWLFACLMLFLALSEGVFWSEFSSRLNFIAVDYLIYTHEVIGNIRESYPVGVLLSGLALLGVGLTFVSRRALVSTPPAPRGGRMRLTVLAAALAMPWASWKLADIDRLEFSGNVYANELSGNGLLSAVGGGWVAAGTVIEALR